MRLSLKLPVGLLCASMAYASFIPISMPDATYKSETTLLPISESEGSIISSETNGSLTISFQFGGMSTLMDVNQVPSSWSTWNSPPNTESSTPKVVRPDDTTQTDIVYLFSTPLKIFGMELEPDDTSMGNMHDLTATFLLGSTPVGTVERLVSGNGGALLFAASSSSPFDRVEVVDNSKTPADFAAAQFRYTPAFVPELPTGVLLFTALAALLVRAVRSELPR